MSSSVANPALNPLPLRLTPQMPQMTQALLSPKLATSQLAALQTPDGPLAKQAASPRAIAAAASAPAAAAPASAAPAAAATAPAAVAPAAPAPAVAPAAAASASAPAATAATTAAAASAAAAADLPEITDAALKTGKGRAHALSVTKDLHRVGQNDEVAIRFDHVTKVYDLYKNDRARFLGLLNIKRKRTGYLGTIKANNDLSFEIKRGEAVAFLGLNGAGKSTALKMITGVVYPTEGEITVNGRVSALLELSAGFDRHLTGRENIRLRAQIMGLSEEEFAEIEPKAIEFADIGVFIDQPMQSYSSGMRARLGFALAVSVNPEILVIDEALSVGDRAFKKKCVARIREIMMNSDVTVLFVTHSTTTAQEFCSRGIVLDHGVKQFDGTMDEAMDYYTEHF